MEPNHENSPVLQLFGKDSSPTLGALQINIQFSDSFDIMLKYQKPLDLTPLAVKAAAIMHYCAIINDWDTKHIIQVSGYSKGEVGAILTNLTEMNFLKDGKLSFYRTANKEEDVIAFFAIAETVAGEIPEDIIVRGPRKLTPIPGSKRRIK